MTLKEIQERFSKRMKKRKVFSEHFGKVVQLRKSFDDDADCRSGSAAKVQRSKRSGNEFHGFSKGLHLGIRD